MTLLESDAIEQVVRVGLSHQAWALVRQRRRVQLVDLSDGGRALDTASLSSSLLHPLHAHLVLALSSSACHLIRVRDGQLHCSAIAVALPLGVDRVCCVASSSSSSSSSSSWWSCWLVSTSVALQPSDAGLLPLLFVRSGADGRLLDVSLAHAASSLRLPTAEVAAPIFVRDVRVLQGAADGRTRVAVLQAHALDALEWSLCVHVLVPTRVERQWRLVRDWSVLRVSAAHGRLVGGLDDAAVALVSCGQLSLFAAAGLSGRAAPALVPAASCAVNDARLVCCVSDAGGLSVLVGDGAALQLLPVACESAPWPADPPHSVVASRVGGERLAVLIASRAHSRLVIVSERVSGRGALTAQVVVDGALASRLPIMDARMTARHVALLCGVPLALQRVAFGVRLANESRGDTDLGGGRLLATPTMLGARTASLVVVTHAHGGAPSSQAFVLDAELAPTSDEIALDESSATLALVSCVAMVTVDAAALQVTPDAVNEIGPRGWSPLWQRPSELARVDVVAVSEAFVALACGATLMLCTLLEVIGAPFHVVEQRDLQHAIAALAVDVQSGVPTVAVSRWVAHDVLLLDGDLATVAESAAPLAERATALAWLRRGSLLVGCGDGAVHAYVWDGVRLAKDDAFRATAGSTPVAFVPVAAEQIVALCGSDVAGSSAGVLLRAVAHGRIDALPLIGGDSVRAACALPATPFALAHLASDDGALVVSRIDGASSAHWSRPAPAADALALDSLLDGAVLVVLFERALALFDADSAATEPRQHQPLANECRALDMLSLGAETLLVLGRNALQWYAMRDGALAFAHEVAIDSSGLVCRVSPTLACVGHVGPPRVSLWRATPPEQVRVHGLGGDDERTIVLDLLPVADGLIAVLSFDRARIWRVDADGAIVFDAALQTRSAARVGAFALLRQRWLLAFDSGGGLSAFDLASEERTTFQRQDFEVPAGVLALPAVHSEQLHDGDRVLKAWRVAECNAQLRTRVQVDNDMTLVLLLASGEVEHRTFNGF